MTATPQEAFDGADILVEASRLTRPEPLLRTSAVGPGAFVVPYGTISAVELDLLDVMDKVVVDDWREAQSGRFGALRPHVDSGRLTAQSLHAELGQIVTGQRPGRERADERILLWHRGLAILDIAVGQLILRGPRRPRRHDAPVPVQRDAGAWTLTDGGRPGRRARSCQVSCRPERRARAAVAAAVQRQCDQARAAAAPAASRSTA